MFRNWYIIRNEKSFFFLKWTSEAGLSSTEESHNFLKIGQFHQRTQICSLGVPNTRKNWLKSIFEENVSKLIHYYRDEKSFFFKWTSDAGLPSTQETQNFLKIEQFHQYNCAQWHHISGS